MPKKYDLVYSFITFQHIPPRRGTELVRKLAEGLSDDGCLALQVTYGLDRSRTRKTLLYMRENIAPIRWVANVIKGRPINTPNMRMHSYSLSAVFNSLRSNGVTELDLEFTDHGGFLGVFIAGRKQK